MILHSKIVEQAIDGENRGHFLKQLLLAQGRRVPIALVRKRALARTVGLGTPVGDDPDRLAAPTRAPILLIHGYGQNRYAFHLPGRSLVNFLASRGFDVFNVDLRGHGRSEHFGANLPDQVEDFVREDLPAALDEVRELSGERRVFLLGHSLGGLCAYALGASNPSQVAGMVSLGSPYHFTKGARLLSGLARSFLAIDRVVDLPNFKVPAHLYGSFVRASQRMVESPFYPVPLRGFRRGSMEPEILRQHMRLAMDQGSIATMRSLFSWGEEARAGRQVLFGRSEKFEQLELPLLVIAGTDDDLAPPASVRPAYDLSSSSDRSYREVRAGHIDLIMAKDAPRGLWLSIGSWLEARAPAAEHVVEEDVA